MRNAIFFSFFTFSTLFFSCSDNTNKNNEEKIVEKEVLQPVNYLSKNIQETYPGCDSISANCAGVSINFPEITDVPQTLDKKLLNKQIKKVILKGALDPEGDAGNIELACEKFIQDFADFKKQMPEDVVPWSIKINVHVINNDAKYFSLRISESSFMGGAHPNQYTSFLNYDVATGEMISLEELTGDTDRLKALAEQEFRKVKNLSVEENLSEAGYFFEGGAFALTDNFGISGGKLLLYYNNYDIAPYALGPTLLELPLDMVL